MRIVYLHQYFNTLSMPGGTRSFEMARRLVAAGHEVNLVTSIREQSAANGWRTTIEEGIRVHWYPVPYSNHMSFTSRVCAFLRFAVASARKAASFDADIVFATSTPLTIAIPGLYAARRLGVPFVFEVRDMWPAVPIAMGILKNRLIKLAAVCLERFAYRCAQHIVALAPGMRDDILAMGIDPSKITVIPNGCDTDIFGANLSSAAIALRSQYAWLQKRKLILFAGTFGQANGLGYLVEVAVHMKKVDPEIRFVVIGDGAERELIQEQARKAKLIDESFFMLPAMQKKELAVWVAACDFTVGLFAGPRVLWKDAVQNKFFDSISAGKPVACNFSGFQSELAVKYEIGLIMPPNDPIGAAHQLYDVLNDTAWMAGARTKARQLADNEFSRDRLAQLLESVLSAAVGEQRAAAVPL